MTEMWGRPGLPQFDYVCARTAAEVVDLLQVHGADARLLMGGTDLLPGLRMGKWAPKVVIDVKPLPGMRDVTYRAGAGLEVGAAVTMNALACHPAVTEHYPLLAQAAASVASYQLRNRATLGGNLCNASPCADTAPATVVLDADLVLNGPDGERIVPAGEFFCGPGKAAIGADEFLVGVRFPPPPEGRHAAHYEKLGRCRTGDLALVGVAATCEWQGDNGDYRFCLGLGSVAPTPLRVRDAEAFLAANPPGDETFDHAAGMAMSMARPITDVRGTAEYQQAMVRTLTRRALREVWDALRR
ncbi:MAG: xanthine dehydrogenase family protein subunit M [Anaerolineae bacterium]|nr:xanthine dehydrogenase family protein subunit M [Anaerolineae bacterium]